MERCTVGERERRVKNTADEQRMEPKPDDAYDMIMIKFQHSASKLKSTTWCVQRAAFCFASNVFTINSEESKNRFTQLIANRKERSVSIGE